MEIIAYILAPFIASGALYYLGKYFLDSIWNGYITFLGLSGELGEEDTQNFIYYLVTKGK